MAFILFLVWIGLFVLGALWFWRANSNPTKYNGLLWLHPDHGGDIIRVNEPSQGQRPFRMRYCWYHLSRKPLYLWYEVKNFDPHTKVATYKMAHWEPTKPPGWEITPNELYDNTDWQCARRFETIKSNITEAVKFGMAMVMVGACVFGIIVLMDMLGKPAV